MRVLREPRKQTVMRPRTKSSLRPARTWGYSSITAVITASSPPNCKGNTNVGWRNEMWGQSHSWRTPAPCKPSLPLSRVGTSQPVPSILLMGSGGGHLSPAGDDSAVLPLLTAQRAWAGSCPSQSHSSSCHPTGAHRTQPSPVPAAPPYRAVQPQCDHHQEEDDGEEGGSHHVGDRFGVGGEKEAWP